MFLICGLGNCGSQYQSTRHNVGFGIIDILSQKYRAPLHLKEKFKAEIAQSTVAASDFMLVKPQTYMNLSGSAVAAIANFYKITASNIIVLHDDLEVAVGQVKVKLGGSSAGHNGLRSIDQVVGPNYLRVRVGIGRPVNGDVANYVLSKFSKQELEIIEILYYKIADALPLLLQAELEQFLDQVRPL
jgi:PTH1 family peptidyl-tRNA hydrolase